MSVPKGRRGLSDFEFYHTARQLREDMTNLLLRDFGVKDSVRKTYEVDGKQVTVVEEYPHWIIEGFRASIIRLLRELILNITAGNSIYPTTPEELSERRRFQTASIINCEQLQQELIYCADILPLKISTVAPFAGRIETEVKLLKGWRKSNKKLFQGSSPGPPGLE
ncbi:hypothetical protein FACS1894172_20830 [Spirochaetia bacterium]|nr:hypothetical protein FACS1894164_03990 [Spirochaetia bacterium]GHU37427.1 hypothetical protein FACS1894172_20830 [Spirochaetia bacterium]